METDIQSTAANDIVVGSSSTGSFDEAIKSAVHKAREAAKPKNHSDQLVLEVLGIRITSGGFTGQTELHVTAKYSINSSLEASVDTEKEQEIRGCLREGVEAGCIILETSDKKTYSLHGNSLPPVTEKLVVDVKGTPGGVSTCNEGTPFKVSSWNFTRMRCPEHS